MFYPEIYKVNKLQLKRYHYLTLKYLLCNACMCCSSNFFVGLTFFKLVEIFQTGVKFSHWFKFFKHLSLSFICISVCKILCVK